MPLSSPPPIGQPNEGTALLVETPEIVTHALSLKNLLVKLIRDDSLNSEITALTINNDDSAVTFFQNASVQRAITQLKHCNKHIIPQLLQNAQSSSSVRNTLLTINILGFIASAVLLPQVLSAINTNTPQIEKSGMGVAGYCNPLFSAQQQIVDTCGNLTNGSKTFFNLYPDPNIGIPLLHRVANWLNPMGWFHYIECSLKMKSGYNPMANGNLTVNMHAFHGSLSEAENYMNTGGFPVLSQTKTTDIVWNPKAVAQVIIFSLMIPFCEAIGNGLYSAEKNAFSKGFQDFGEVYKEKTNYLTASYMALTIATGTLMIGLLLHKCFSKWQNSQAMDMSKKINQAVTLFQDNQTTDNAEATTQSRLESSIQQR